MCRLDYYIIMSYMYVTVCVYFFSHMRLYNNYIHVRVCVYFSQSHEHGGEAERNGRTVDLLYFFLHTIAQEYNFVPFSHFPRGGKHRIICW